MNKDTKKILIIVGVIIIGFFLIKGDSNFIGSLVGTEPQIPYQITTCNTAEGKTCDTTTDGQRNVFSDFEEGEGIFVGPEQLEAEAVLIKLSYQLSGSNVRLKFFNYETNVYEEFLVASSSEGGGLSCNTKISSRDILLSKEYLNPANYNSLKFQYNMGSPSGCGEGSRSHGELNPFIAMFDYCPEGEFFKNGQCVEFECLEDLDCSNICIGKDYNYDGFCQDRVCIYSVQQDSSLCLIEDIEDNNGDIGTNTTNETIEEELRDCFHAGLTSYCQETFGSNYQCVNYQCILVEEETTEDSSTNELLETLKGIDTIWWIVIGGILLLALVGGKK